MYLLHTLPLCGKLWSMPFHSEACVDSFSTIARSQDMGNCILALQHSSRTDICHLSYLLAKGSHVVMCSFTRSRTVILFMELKWRTKIFLHKLNVYHLHTYMLLKVTIKRLFFKVHLYKHENVIMKPIISYNIC
jgi:hypothetical protein